MKITTFIILIAIMHVSAASMAQNINLSESKTPLKEVFRKLKIQSGYNFVCTEGDLKIANPVSINVSNGKIEDVLNIIFKEQPLTYSISNNTVVIQEKAISALEKFKATIKSITGKITDEKGKPLPGVSVFNKTTKKGTVTDQEGQYDIASAKGDVISFTFIGYKPKEVIVADQASISFSMTPSSSDLDQVVVVGYGSTVKKDLTGAVSTVSAKDIEDIPFNTVDNALAGKAAGVDVTKSDGTPGGAVRIRIRGSSSLLGGNDPLYVIDGVPLQVTSNFVSPGFSVGSPSGNQVGASGGFGNSAGLSASFVNGLNSLGGLNPDDIESITILKDASSTAIYGSKAANGVVIITTKTGKKDMTPMITASYYSTVTSLYKTPNLLNGPQYRSLITEAAQNDYNTINSPEGQAGGFTVGKNVTAILNNPNSYFGTANTNWIKEVTRTTVSNNAELAVQGGSNASKYFSSISYNSTPGVVDGTDFQRISGKINLENQISPKFKFITNLVIGYTNQNIGDGAYTQALTARPDWSPYTSTGAYTNFNTQGNGYGSEGFINPVALLQATNNAKTVSLLGSISGIYNITKELAFKSTVSLNDQSYNQRIYLPSFVNISNSYGNTANTGGIGNDANRRFTDWFLENTLNYNKNFDSKNSLNVLVGQSYETTKASYFSATGTGYPNDNVLTSLSSAVTPLIVSGDDPTIPQAYLLSFYARANYSYMDKYLLTFTGRTDGSSKFGPNNKFGYFPSGAVAWRISQEDFLKNISWIDDIKLRGSYGITGNQNIGDQMYRTLFSPTSYAGSSALVPTQLGNPGIKWESTNETDAGIDISLFKGRLTATIDYYNKQTSGDLLSLPVASSSSYSSVLENAIGIRNRGFEVTIGGDIIREKDFRWDASLNVTFSKSIVTKLSANADLSQIGSLTGLESFGNTASYTSGNTTLIQGQPLGLITGYTVTGIIKTKAQLDAYNKQLGQYAVYFPPLEIGDPMFKLDASTASEGFEAPAYNTVIGDGAPKYYGGMTQGFTYKHFNLQFYFTYSVGGHLLWSDHVSSTEFYGTANANTSILNRYTPTNTNTNEPRLVLNDSQYQVSNLDVFGSSYLKLRTLTLNYTFDKTAKWMMSAGMKSASFFMSATNVFTITKYPGNDPEVSDDPYSVSGGYIDVSNYPTVRTFSLGFKAGF